MITLIREISGNSAQFFTYEATKRYIFGPRMNHFQDYQLRNVDGNHETFVGEPSVDSIGGWKAMVCGGVAGFNAWLFSYGADIIKTKIQCENYGFYKSRFYDGGMVEVGKEIYKKSGIRGFFRGFNAITGRAIIGNAFGFWGWETSKKYIKLDWVSQGMNLFDH